MRGKIRLSNFLMQSYVIDPVTNCWNWAGPKAPNGYGFYSDGDYKTNAHRAMWEEFKGEIPKGLTLDHKCRNRLCVNPEHLEIVTVAENVRRGRSAKITKAIAIEIKRLISIGIHDSMIALRLKVSQGIVKKIRLGYRWKDIEKSQF